MAREVVEQYGDVTDWRNVVGTGPFELTDHVEGSSLTYTKNPDYWGYDEKYPQNRLPYVDEIRALVIPDKATRVAALRAGKIDYLGFLNWTQINSIDTVESLGRTNPEIVAEPFFAEATTAFVLNPTKPPFDDINVRRAIQMALDIETINVTYWKGWALTEPQGYTAAAVIGYVTPFEEWPEEVKQYYRYDPAGAEALLDAAGYPRGADGTRFKTNLIVRPSWDLSWYELAAEYFREIGVDVVEVEAGLDADWGTSITEMTYEMAAVSAGNTWGKFTPMLQGVSTSEWNPLGVRDPAYDALVESAVTATTVEEQMRLSSEANMWLTKNHRYVWGGKSPKFSVTQPWVIGHNGEVTLSPVDYGPVFARLWIDSELKKAMGR
jgi:peptide/nickel transport system substrate-binding protein